MADKFAIRISGVLSPLLKVIKVNRESAFVELSDDALSIQFGYVNARIPYTNIATAEKGSWSIAYGYGLRIAPKKTMSYVSATSDVAYVALKEAQDLKAGPGDMSISRERVAISLEEPDMLVDALKAKLG